MSARRVQDVHPLDLVLVVVSLVLVVLGLVAVVAGNGVLSLVMPLVSLGLSVYNFTVPNPFRYEGRHER